MDDATVGNYLLIINNRKDSFYTYETTSLSLKGGSFYKFSAYVRTAWLAKGKNAMAKITIGEDTYTLNVNTGTYDDAGKETIGGWKIINFYIHNEKSDATDAKLAFILGENTDAGKLQGYYFIDNVSLYTIDEDQFTTETAAFRDFTQDENGADVQTEANKTFRLSNSVIELKDEETTEEKDTDNDDNDSTDDSDSGLNMTLLWTYITSIAIAVVLIAVIVVWLIKKYRRPKKSVGAGNTTASYDRNNATKPEEQKDEGTGSARNEYKD